MNLATYTIAVGATNAATKEYFLDKVPDFLKNNTIKGVATRRKTATTKTISNKSIINDNVFDSSFLTLKIGSREQIMRLPLSYIEFNNTSCCKYFELNICNIDFSNSFISIENQAAIIADEYFEITFFYESNYC